METLACAFQNADRKLEREHTTPFIWQRPERFRIANVAWETGFDFSKTHRFTIDHAEDYRFVSRIYGELCSAQRPVFSLSEILQLLQDHPEISELNAKYRGQSWHLAHADELRHFRPETANVTWRHP